MINSKIVLCTDLDRTLLPNGEALEAGNARTIFNKLVMRPEVVLVYVSGRDQALVRQAIQEYQLPSPHYVIADVGASIYRLEHNDWHLISKWQALLAADWHGLSSQQLSQQLINIGSLKLQPQAHQSEFKLSYQLASEKNLPQAVADLTHELKRLNINFNCISSIDETKNIGLVDILPQVANKYLAIQFLVDELGIEHKHIVFSGDSGNDMDVLISPFKAILVGNATEEVRNHAQQQVINAGNENTLYCAHNNYAAGIVEGVLYYFPGFNSIVHKLSDS